MGSLKFRIRVKVGSETYAGKLNPTLIISTPEYLTDNHVDINVQPGET